MIASDETLIYGYNRKTDQLSRNIVSKMKQDSENANKFYLCVIFNQSLLLITMLETCVKIH